MKYSAVLLLALFGLAAASSLQEQVDVLRQHNNNRNNNDNNIHHGDHQFLDKQETVLHLLSNLEQNNPSRYMVQLGRNFNPHENLDKFQNGFAVKMFLKNYNNNQFLPQDDIFSPTIQQHQNQAAQLFHFLYSAQDWTTLKQAAAWARGRINPQQFAYAFTAAILNHPSTKGIVVPAMYEVVPHAFIPATAMQQIYTAKIQGYNHVTVHANYTNQNQDNMNYVNKNYMNMNGNNNNENNNNNNYGPHNPNHVFAENTGSQNNNAGTSENPENRMSYFTEDVGINAFHSGFHVQNPSFFGTNNNNNYYDNIMNKLIKTTRHNNNNRNNNNNCDNNDDMDNDNNNDNCKNNADLVNENNNNDDETLINNLLNNQKNSYNAEAVKRGEAFYYSHQQLYARYVLERLSNNLPIPHPMNFNDKIKDGYNPRLQYSNGQAIPARSPNTKFQQQMVENNNDNNNAQTPNNNQAQHPQVYEQRLQQVAESGYVLNEDGSKTKLNNQNAIGVLANLAAAPADSPNPSYYGDYFTTAKNAIGNIVDPNNQNGVAPGPVANLATAARDPAYYQLLAKLNQIFNNLQNNMGPYTQSQLNFNGVKIEDMDVSSMITYFEKFNVNVNNGVNTNTNNQDNNNNGNYNVMFQRLTNKPFNYRMTVRSDKNTNAVVRVFIGPKYDSNGQKFTLPQASQYFVQLDQFTVQLRNGKNMIQRNSEDSPNYVQDSPSFQHLWNRVQQAKQGQQPFFVNKAESRHCGFPQRTQLPKGKMGGQKFVVYTIITETHRNNDNMMNGNTDNEATMNGNNFISNRKFESFHCGGNNYIQSQDTKSIGYPFDRPIVDVNYNTPNQYFKTVTIYHKTETNNY